MWRKEDEDEDEDEEEEEEREWKSGKEEANGNWREVIE